MTFGAPDHEHWSLPFIYSQFNSSILAIFTNKVLLNLSTYKYSCIHLYLLLLVHNFWQKFAKHFIAVQTGMLNTSFCAMSFHWRNNITIIIVGSAVAIACESYWYKTLFQPYFMTLWRIFFQARLINHSVEMLLVTLTYLQYVFTAKFWNNW